MLPKESLRQRVLIFPYELRFLLAQQPAVMGKVLEIIHRTLAPTRSAARACLNCSARWVEDGEKNPFRYLLERYGRVK